MSSALRRSQIQVASFQDPSNGIEIMATDITRHPGPKSSMPPFADDISPEPRPYGGCTVPIQGLFFSVFAGGSVPRQAGAPEAGNSFPTAPGRFVNRDCMFDLPIAPSLN